MYFWEQIAVIEAQLRTIEAELQEAVAIKEREDTKPMNMQRHKKELDGLKDGVRILTERLQALRAALSLNKEIRSADFENKLRNAVEQLGAAWGQYREILPAPARDMTVEEDLRMEAWKKADGAIGKLGSVLHESGMEQVVDSYVSVRKLLRKNFSAALSVDTEDMKARSGRGIILSDGVTTVRGYAEKSPKAIAGRILWVGENLSLLERACEREGKDYEEELARLDQKPVNEYDHLMEYLRNAGQETRTEAAMFLVSREHHLRESLRRTRETLRNRYLPERQSDRERLTEEERDSIDRRVNEDLVNDKSFRDLRSFLALKERLLGGPLASELKLVTEWTFGTEVPDKNIVGDLTERLSGTESGRKALEKAAEKDAKDLGDSGLVTIKHPFVIHASDLLEKMSRCGKSGNSWNALARQLYTLRNADYTDLTSGKLKDQAYACLTAAEVYIQDHKRPWSENGINRRNLAKEIRVNVNALLGTIREAEAAQNISAEEAQRLEEKRHKSAREFEKLARYQSNVGTCKIHTEAPYRQTMEVVSDAHSGYKGTLKHGIYNCIKLVNQAGLGLPGNIAGAVMLLKNKQKIRNALASAPDYDAEHVPGMREERYREPEAGEIITDKRRIPLVWEKVIPGDPSQPFTLTFEVDQPFEGQDYSSDSAFEKVGHTFLTLRYSKKDPFTGQMRRYKTSFGFYPKNPDSYLQSRIQQAGASTIGAPQIGLIRNDDGHAVSVGAAVEITPEQFNDIIRFTGEYEKGGYNMVTRNCTTFAVDAIKHAGISMPQLEGVKPTDFVHKGISWQAGAHAVGDMFAGMVLEKELVKNVMADAAQTKDTTQYTHLQQNIASKQDLEHVLSADLNQRLRGYNPGQAGEVIRGSYGFKLHSKKYQGKKETQERAFNQLTEAERNTYKPENDKSSSWGSASGSVSGSSSGEHGIAGFEASRVRLKYTLALMREEIPRLRRKIEKVYGKSTDLREVLDRIEKFQNTSIEAMENSGKAIFAENVGNYNSQRRNALKNSGNGMKQVDEYIEGMNQIYRDVFAADTRVNLPFQHTVSLAEYLKGAFETLYQNVYEVDPYDTDRTADLEVGDRKGYYEMSKDLYSESLDMSDAMWKANQVRTKYSIRTEGNRRNTYSMTPSELLATMLTFENPEEAIRQFALAEDSEKIEKMESLRSTMVRALETWQDGHEYTAEELKASFIRLPELEEKIREFTGKASSVYQSFAFSNILGNGVLGDLNQRFRQMVEEKKKELTPDADNREYVRNRNRLIRQRNGLRRPENQAEIDALTRRIEAVDREYYDRITEVLPALQPVIARFADEACTRLDQVLNNLPEEKKKKLDKITGVIEEDLAAKRAQAAGRELTAQERESCRLEAGRITGKKLVQSYLNSICGKAVKEMILIDGPDQLISDALTTCSGYLRNKDWIPAIFRPAVNNEYVPINNREEEEEAGAQVKEEQHPADENEKKQEAEEQEEEEEEEEEKEEEIIKNHRPETQDWKEIDFENLVLEEELDKYDPDLQPEKNDLYTKNENLLSADMDYIKKLGRDCVFLSMENTAMDKLSPEEVVGQILWLGENDVLSRRLEREYGGSRPKYDKAQIGRWQERIEDENAEKDAGPLGEMLAGFQNADNEKLMQYAMLFANRQRQLIGKVKAEKNKIRRSLLPEGGENRVFAELVKRKCYRDLRSFLDLKAELMKENVMAGPLSDAMAEVGMESEIPDIHGIESRLRRTAEGKQALSEALKKDFNDLNTSGMPVNNYSAETFLLLRDLGRMKDQSGDSWQKIMNKLTLVQTEAPYPYSPAYRQRVLDCLTAAESYLQAHEGFRFTSKGTIRQAGAENIQKVMNRILNLDPYHGIITSGGHSVRELEGPGKRAGLQHQDKRERASSNIIGYLRWRHPEMAELSVKEMSSKEEYRTAFAGFKDFLKQNAIYDADQKLLEKEKLTASLSNLAEYHFSWIKALREKKIPDLFHPAQSGEFRNLKQEITDCLQNMEPLSWVNVKENYTGQNEQNRKVFYFDCYPKNGKRSGVDQYSEDDAFLRNCGYLFELASRIEDSEKALYERIVARLALDSYAKETAGKSLEEFCISDQAADMQCYATALRAVVGEKIFRLVGADKNMYENYVRNGGEMPEKLRSLLEEKGASIRQVMAINKEALGKNDIIEKYKKKNPDWDSDEEEIFAPKEKKGDSKIKNQTGEITRINVSELEKQEKDSKYHPIEEDQKEEKKEENPHASQYQTGPGRRNHH